MRERHGICVKKKLLVTASTFPRWEGDTEPRFVLDLCKHLTEYFDVTVLAPAALGAKNKEVLEGVKVIRYHYFPVHKWETLCYPGAILPRIQEKKVRILLVPFLFMSLYLHLCKLTPHYDIVNAHWLIPQGIVQSFFKIPYVITGHGGDVTSLNKGIIRKLKIRCLKRAKHVVVISDFSKEKVRELLPDVRPSIISMGVNTSQFSRRFRVPDYFGQGDKKVVLFVGRLVEIKGVAYLIEAMRNVDARLIIVGDGPIKAELEAQAAGMEEGKVSFLGAKTHEELKTIYASADIFASPSITLDDGAQEGVPTTIMEAMASGLVVVASNSGGIPHLVKDGINGFLCEEKNISQLAQRITLLLTDNEMYDKLCRNSVERIKEFDYKSLAAKYAEILK